MDLARDMGMEIEVRPVPVEELAEFDETGACGTAAVISPICKIVDHVTGKVYNYCKDGSAGPVSTKLYKRLQAIQFGDEPDVFNWNYIVE
jgi:branched-chain amino acid aminotransferase